MGWHVPFWQSGGDGGGGNKDDNVFLSYQEKETETQQYFWRHLNIDWLDFTSFGSQHT